VNVTLVEVGTEKCEICLLATGWHKSRAPCSPVDCFEVSEQPAASIFKVPIELHHFVGQNTRVEMFVEHGAVALFVIKHEISHYINAMCVCRQFIPQISCGLTNWLSQLESQTANVNLNCTKDPVRTAQ
jgi:hypothetical protein